MVAVLVISVVLIICILLSILFDHLMDYQVECIMHPMRPKIKFDQFKEFYLLNPDRWTLGTNEVTCHINSDSHVDLGFRFLDYSRYKSWHTSIINNQRNQTQAKLMANVIAAVKQDIAASEAKAKRMQEEFLNTLKYTYKNIPDDDLMNLVDEYNKLYGQHYKR